MKITPYTNTIVINGEIHRFCHSRRQVGCKECSLGGLCNPASHGGAKHLEYLCKYFLLSRYPTFRFGNFKLLRQKDESN